MKIVFVGGGSFRTLPIVRAAMRKPSALAGGEIHLVDTNLARAETVGRLIQKTPEYRAGPCRVAWTGRLDRALPGADLVSVSFPVGSPAVCERSNAASLKHGFYGSDQLTLSGAFRAVTGGVVLLDIARRMEKHCPKAWLADFANPVAVYSGMVNNHTRVRALGICGGMNNYRWDLERLLFNRDAYGDGFQVAVAGVNHFSFIVRGTCKGRDLYPLLRRRILRPGWAPCRMPLFPKYEAAIRQGLVQFADVLRRFGILIFSGETDGLMHLFPDETVDDWRRGFRARTAAQLRKLARESAEGRARADAAFRAHLDRPLDAAFWAQTTLQNPHFGTALSDPTVAVIRALGGTRPQWLAASYPNRGAVRGFKDRTVLEYSFRLDRRGVHPDPDLEVPACFHGLITALAEHQTLLGDAVAARDPRLFAHALFAYPLQQSTRRARALWRDLLRIHAPEMPAVFQKAADYF